MSVFQFWRKIVPQSYKKSNREICLSAEKILDVTSQRCQENILLQNVWNAQLQHNSVAHWNQKQCSVINVYESFLSHSHSLSIYGTGTIEVA